MFFKVFPGFWLIVYILAPSLLLLFPLRNLLPSDRTVLKNMSEKGYLLPKLLFLKNMMKCISFYLLLNFFAASFSDCLRDDIHTYIFSLLTITIFHFQWSVLIETLLSYRYLFLLYAINALCTTSTHNENICHILFLLSNIF